MPKDILENQKVTYIWNGQNMGLAYALNQGAELAINEGWRYLLTLDQDSAVESGMVEALLSVTGELEHRKIGILAPGELIGLYLTPFGNRNLKKSLTVWTSGSLLSLAAYQKVGPFRDDLFIDFVDHEYCLRLSAAGFGIYRVRGARMTHGYGEDCRKTSLFGRSFWITNHSPLRRYYIMRNRLLVRSLYRRTFPGFFRKDQLCMLMEIFSVLFFERQKWAKFRMMARGVRDYRRGTLGEYRG